MLQDMRNSRSIRRVGLEAYTEHIIRIISCNMKMFRSSLVVSEEQCRELKLWDVLGLLQCVSMVLRAWLWQS